MLRNQSEALNHPYSLSGNSSLQLAQQLVLQRPVVFQFVAIVLLQNHLIVDLLRQPNMD